MTYNPKIHHRSSIRLPEYDYTQLGAYFITIVTCQRQNLFGEVVDGEMMLNQFGLLVRQQWVRLPQRFPHIELDEFGIMPNHFHGIIAIVNELLPESSEHFGKPVVGSIPTIIRSFKSTVSLRIILMQNTRGMPVWQTNYYEHVIRNERDLLIKRDYILNNPSNWQKDDEYHT